MVLARRQIQGEFTIHVSQHTGLCTNHFDCGTDDRLTVFL